jgi:hypothetical protein
MTPLWRHLLFLEKCRRAKKMALNCPPLFFMVVAKCPLGGHHS